MVSHIPDEQLSAWLEDDLPSEERVAIDAHMERCDRCQEELSVLRAIIHGAREGPGEWPGKEEVWEVLASRLASPHPRALRLQGRFQRGPAREPRWRSGSRRLVAASLAAAAVISLVVVVHESQPPENPAVGVLLQTDREVRNNVMTFAERGEWGTPAARQAIAVASRDIDGGIEALQRGLRERPDDPVLLDLLRRATEHRTGLIMEVTR